MPTNDMFLTGFGANFRNQNFTAPTKQQKFPGLSDEQIKRLESISSNPQEQQKLYQQAIQQLNQNNIKENRIATENEMAYKNLNQKDIKQKNYTDSQIRLEQLADLAKDKYGLIQEANTLDVINGVIGMAQDGGVSLDAMNSYLDTGDETFLYDMGLKERPNEKLGESRWESTWDKMKVESSVPGDAWEKLIYRTGRDLNNLYTRGIDIAADIVPKSWMEKRVGREILDEEYDNAIGEIKKLNQNTRDVNKQKVLDYNQLVNYDYQKSKGELDQDIENYYGNKGYTELLKEGDFGGFFYKGFGDAAQNWEMPVIIGATVVNPEMGRTLMAVDSYARESEEAFESMIQNGATYEQAETGGAVVGMINAAVEVYLDKALGGVETKASDEIRRLLKKNIQKEAINKGLGTILWEAGKTQLTSSAEEGLEEIVQQIVQNAAVKTVNENQKLFEGLGDAFEGGFFNPMNILAGGGNLTQNIQANKDYIKQSTVDSAKNLVSSTKNAINTTKDSISEKVDSGKGKVANLIDATYGIDKTLKKNIQDNPYSAEVWKRTQDWIDKNGRPEKSKEVASSLIDDVVERVQKSLTDKMEEGSETGRLYKPLLDAGYSVDLSELKNGIDEMLGEYGIKVEDGKLNFDKTAIDGSEASNIRRIYNWIQDINSPMSLEEYKNRFRKTMSNMVEFNQNGRDPSGRKRADTEGDKVIKGIRSFANDLAHNQIPELAALDKQFNEWVEVMDEVSDGLVYKEAAKRGVIKDNITQIISNLDNKNRRQLANRLEKLMPGIREEVSAINMMPQLINHYYNPSKQQQTFTTAAGGLVGSAIGSLVGGPIIGTAVGAGVGYWLSGKIDKLKSAKWDKVISETSKDGKAKMDSIQKKIKNNQKITQDQKAFLNEISSKLKERKQVKEGEVMRIISDIMSAEEGKELAVLDKAISELETLGAKDEVKEWKKFREDMIGKMNEEAEMNRYAEEFEAEKQNIINESADQRLPEFKERIYKLQQEEKRIGSVAGKKIGKTFEGKDYKNQQETEWLRKKDKLIEEIGEYYNVDQQEASEIYDRIEKTVSMDDLNRKKTRTKEDITKEYQDKAREKFGIEGDSVPYELTQTDEYKALENDYRNELENADSTEDIATKLNNDINNMEVGDKIRVLEDFEGEEIETTIEKRKNGYAIYHDGVRDFIYNDQISPDGFLGRMNIVSYEKI